MPVIGSGTYKLYPKLIMSQVGAWEVYELTPPYATDILDAIKSPPYGTVNGACRTAYVLQFSCPADVGDWYANDPGLYSLTVLPDDLHILINEGLPGEYVADINTLPAGFVATSGRQRLFGSLSAVGMTGQNAVDFKITHGGTVLFNVVTPPGYNLGDLTTLNFAPPATPTLLVSDQWHIEVEMIEAEMLSTACGDFPWCNGELVIMDWFVEGSYDIIAFWWTIPEVDACGERSAKRYKFSAEQPVAPTGEGTYQRLDEDDPDAAPQPVILALEPSSGWTAGTTAVTIKGDGFGEDAQVFFDSDPATDVVVVSAKQITCIAPPHAAGYVAVTVVNVDGVSS